MAKCSKCGSPLCKCGSPNHYSDSPMKQIGIVDPMNQAMAQQPVAPQMSQPMAQPMTNVTPAGSSLVNPFSPQTQAVAQSMFGPLQMRQDAVNAPAMFKDQTGDGKITQADVIKARIEGYKK